MGGLPEVEAGGRQGRFDEPGAGELT